MHGCSDPPPDAGGVFVSGQIVEKLRRAAFRCVTFLLIGFRVSILSSLVLVF